MQLNSSKVRYHGITDECTECQCCGRTNLKKTVMLLVLDADGNDVELTYYGTACAAKALNTTPRYVTRAAVTAEEERQRRIRTLEANLTVTLGARYPEQARRMWREANNWGHALTVNGVEYDPRNPEGPIYKDFVIAQIAAWRDELARLTRTHKPAPAPAPEPAAAPRTAKGCGHVKASTRRNGDREYTGVIRIGGKVIIECGHTHTNRDTTSRSGGRSAGDCIRNLIKAAQRPAFAAHEQDRIRNAWQALTRGFHIVSPTTIAEARAQDERTADAYPALVARVAALIDEHGACPSRYACNRPTAPAIELEPVGAAPAWMYDL